MKPRIEKTKRAFNMCEGKTFLKRISILMDLVTGKIKDKEPKKQRNKICTYCGKTLKEHHSKIGYIKDDSYCNPNMQGNKFKQVEVKK